MAYPVFDLHCDTADVLALGHLGDELSRAVCDLMPSDIMPGVTFATHPGQLSRRTVGATPWAQCFACFIPDPLTPEVAAGFCQEVFRHLDEECAHAGNGLVAVVEPSEIRASMERGVAAVKTIENATLFAHDLGLVHEMRAQGVLMASLSWNGAGPLAAGHDAESQGLTARGREAVRLMEEEHMVLDVSHLNDRSFDDVAAIATRPFVASHSNSRAVCPHPRGLTDAQFAEIRDRGGIVGFNYANEFIVDTSADPGRQATLDDVARHIEHWLDMGGEDVLALGSDFDGCTPPVCLADATATPALQEMLERRFGATVARKMSGGNALAFFERWAG